MDQLPTLTDAERARYEWQDWVDGLGEEGQRRLKAATVLVSRVGGVGGNVALQLAAAGVGRILLAHAGPLRPDNLNRQILMSQAGLGQTRVDQAAARLRELNPLVDIEAIAENVTADNVDRLVGRVSVVASCAPLVQERLWLNEAAVRHGKPLVDCAMYELEGQLLSVRPGQSACLACLYPEAPPAWKRQFPVVGAVAGAVGCLGALEAIKIITGLGTPLYDRMLVFDGRTMNFRILRIDRRPG